jgi:hypothetical protein
MRAYLTLVFQRKQSPDSSSAECRRRQVVAPPPGSDRRVQSPHAQHFHRLVLLGDDRVKFGLGLNDCIQLRIELDQLFLDIALLLFRVGENEFHNYHTDNEQYEHQRFIYTPSLM